MSMFLGLLALALAVGAMCLRGRKDSKRIRLGLVLAALAVLGLTWMSRSPAPDSLAYEEVAGYRLGQVLMETVEGDGPILVLRDPSELASEEYTAGRSRGLRQACPGNVVIEAGPDLLGLGPPSGDFYILEGEDWVGQAVAWCREYPDAVAVVSLFLEFPPIGDNWPKDLPPLYGFAAGPSQAWVKTMLGGRLMAVVRYLPGADTRASPPRGASTEEAFDSRFEMITTDTLRERFGTRRSTRSGCGESWGERRRYPVARRSLAVLNSSRLTASRLCAL